MFQTHVAQKIKTHILRPTAFFRGSCHLWYNVEKYCSARQATDEKTVGCTRFACWIIKATDTHTQNM